MGKGRERRVLRTWLQGEEPVKRGKPVGDFNWMKTGLGDFERDVLRGRTPFQKNSAITKWRECHPNSKRKKSASFSLCPSGRKRGGYKRKAERGGRILLRGILNTQARKQGSMGSKGRGPVTCILGKNPILSSQQVGEPHPKMFLITGASPGGP